MMVWVEVNKNYMQSEHRYRISRAPVRDTIIYQAWTPGNERLPGRFESLAKAKRACDDHKGSSKKLPA